MARYLKKNNSEGTLDTTINDSTLTVILGSGEGTLFPGLATGEQFKIQIENEILLVDSRSTDTLTIATGGRGHDNTTPAAHTAPVDVFLVATAEDYLTRLSGYPMAEPVAADNNKFLVWNENTNEYVFDAMGTVASPARTLLGEHVLGADATYLEVANIPSGYKDLHIVADVKSDRSDATTDGALLQVGNGTVDTGASDYAYMRRFWGDSGSTVQDKAASSIYAGIVAGEKTAAEEADVFGGIQALLLGYDETDHYRVIIGEGAMYAPVADISYQTDFSGAWLDTTDPIDVIRLSPDTGSNWLAESSLRVYGTSIPANLSDRASPPPAKVDPSNLSGLILHLDASQITGLSDGDFVTSWTDLSSSSNAFVQAVEANQPTYQTGEINTTMPVVRFDGGDYLSAGTLISETDSTTFVVANRTGGTGYRGLFITDDVAMYSSNNSDEKWSFYVGGAIRDTGWFSGAAFQTFTFRSATTGSNLNQASRIDGISAYTSGGTGRSDTSTVLGWGGSGQYHIGDIAEVIFYDRALSVWEMEAVEAYLTEKWGLDGDVVPEYPDSRGESYAILPGLKPPDRADGNDEEWLFDTTSPPGWSWGNQGTATVKAGKRRLALSVPSSSSYSLRAIGHAVPSGDFDVTVPVTPNQTGVQYQTTGIGLLWGTMATPTRVETIRIVDKLSSNLFSVGTDVHSNLTTFTSTHDTIEVRQQNRLVWFKIAWDDTAEELELSYTMDVAAEIWTTVTTGLAGPGTSPDFVVLFGSDQSSDARVSLFGPVRFNWTPDYRPGSTPDPVAPNPENLFLLSDPSDPLSTGTGKARLMIPPSWGTAAIQGIYLACDTAPTGATIICDFDKNGTTVFTTQGNRPSIAISAFDSGVEDVPDVTALVGGDYLTMDIDQIGSTIAGSVLTGHVRVRRLT